MLFKMPKRFSLECDDYVQVMPIPRFLELALPIEAHLMEFMGDNDWEDYPFLIVDPDTFQVFGHEGRHRIAAMQTVGYTHVEVVIQIQPDPKRFNSNIEAMGAWQWSGVKPDIDQLIPEIEWLK